MKNHFFISLAAGIALSTAALYFAFRSVPLGDLLKYLGSINYLWMIPAVFLVLVSFFLRALRWQFILASSHNDILLDLAPDVLVITELCGKTEVIYKNCPLKTRG